jgi:hypothetical protein
MSYSIKYAIKATKFANGDPEPNGDYVSTITYTETDGSKTFTSHPSQDKAMIFETREFAEEFLAEQRAKGKTTYLVSIVEVSIRDAVPIKYDFEKE